MTDLRSAHFPPLRDDDHVRGPAGAPLVVVYADLSCPRCAVAAQRLAHAPVRTCFRHFALAGRHPRAVPLACAAEAAGAQGAFWAFHDGVYADQGRIDDPHLWALAERLGLDLTRFEADRRAAAAAKRVTRDVHDAMRGGAGGTPALLLGGDLVHEIPDSFG